MEVPSLSLSSSSSSSASDEDQILPQAVAALYSPRNLTPQEEQDTIQQILQRRGREAYFEFDLIRSLEEGDSIDHQQRGGMKFLQQFWKRRRQKNAIRKEQRRWRHHHQNI